MKTYFHLDVFYFFSYHALNHKHKQLLSCHSSFTEDRDELKTPPAKRPKNEDDENCTDPIQLPEPCANKIIQYLTGKELLNAMLVSKSWRNFIKMRGSLMDKVLYKPKEEEELLVPTEENKRDYKHMRGPLIMRGVVNPIALYASTLETLEIETDGYDDIGNDYSMYAANYPKLRRLACNVEYLQRLFESSFPALTYLSLVSFFDYFNDKKLDIAAIKKILRLTPKLEVLELDSSFFPRNRELKLIDPHMSSDQLPNIKTLCAHDYAPNFMKAFQLTLENLEIYQMYKKDIDHVLQNFKALKSLKVTTALMLSTSKFPRNDSIETLKIFDISVSSLLIITRPQLMELLLALPSLKELVLLENAVNEDILKFLGENFSIVK